MNPYVGIISAPEGPVESWPVVTCNGVRWYVSPIYMAPVARVDVAPLCEEWSCEVPTKDLVDAIWRAADLRLDPWKVVRSPNDDANGRSMGAYHRQREKLERLVDGQPYTLLAGSHKDMAIVDSHGRIDLYGWHLRTGALIEKGATSHVHDYVDYSQGLRLVRRVAA